jgi:ABC-type uncharacterized transport system substrate-binding protein
MAYGPNRLDTAKQLATYVDKILHGAKPADLPVELECPRIVSTDLDV